MTVNDTDRHGGLAERQGSRLEIGRRETGVGSTPTPSAIDSLPRRVRAKFTVTDGCWPWHAARFGNGYGQMWDPVARKNRLAHRYVYELLVGPVPDGLHLDHLCLTKACVNPTHLEPVTSAENARRHHAAQTTCKSGLHPKSGLGTCRECQRGFRRDWLATHPRDRRAA